MSEESIIRITIAVVALIIGIGLGYMIGISRRKDASSKLTQLQIASILMFFAYLLMTSALDVQFSDLVATGILAITGGERVGKILADRAKK